jgi:hypothetical protein
MCTARGLRARTLREHSTNSGTITVRDQYDTLSRWNGNHFGSSMISTGIYGTPRHGSWPNIASVSRVNTLARAAPPYCRMMSRARTICGACGLSPASLSA